jgi:DNA helicase II / ATP-dependent DNA helicase PcrA
MRQIVNSIQKEQNAVIRDEARKVLVVQGPAGSGKTSIAMHRAAWLLYRHRGHISANNLLVFSPSEVFADYISNVLPELGEENIREATFEDYARSMLGKKVGFEPKAEQMEFLLSHAKDADYAIRTASIAFKSSRAFLNIMRNYERHLRGTLRFEDITLNNVRLLPAATVKELYWEHCADLPIMAGITRLKDRVLSRCTYSSDYVERKIESLVDKVLPDRNPVRLYRKLFTDFHLVQQLADEGDALPDNLHAICKHTRKSVTAKRVPYEDVAPIILLRRLIDGEPRYANVRHLIIDEAQDYTPIHFEIIRQLFGESSMTILGDLSQRVNPYSGLDSYDVLGDILGGDARAVAELTKSYRSTWEISEFAQGILPTAIIADNVRRSGRRPEVIRAEHDRVATLISDEITRLQSEGNVSVAVICKTAHEAAGIYSKLLGDHDIRLVEADSITFHHGLVVLPIYLAKGLEFDAVIIHDAGSSTYGAETDRKLLYTACTRALHSLTLYHEGELSPLVRDVPITR